MKKKNVLLKCQCCGESITEETAFAFNFNDELHFFCESHAYPFKMGISIGQVEINSKFLSYISQLPDPISKQEIKKALLQLAPMTKVNAILDPKTEEVKFIPTVETPQNLFDEVSKIVIGQDLAKKTIAVSVINHLQSIEDEGPSTQSDKHHVLMLGRSGSGKTLIAHTVANALNLPFSIGDATNYSPTGFQGADAESSIYDLIIDSSMEEADFKLAERGIVFIDELDKICCSNKSSGTRYESFIGSTQSTLLKLIEGKIVRIPGPVFGEPPGTCCNLDTSRMLFFFGGAFNGLSEIIAKKMGHKESIMGFKKVIHDEDKNKEIDEAMKAYEIFSVAPREVMVESLIEYGMLAEMVGRIPTIVALKPLSKEDLKKVLLDSSASPVEKQKELFRKSGYCLSFTEEFLNQVVDLSYKSATGTRALDSYIKHSVSSASFDLLSLAKHKSSKGNILITEGCINDPSVYEKSKLHVASISFSTSI